MKPSLLFNKEMPLTINGSTKKEIFTALAVKKGDTFSTKLLPKNILKFAKEEMTPNGYIVITLLMDVLLTVIGLDKVTMKTCDSILFVRGDRIKEGSKGLGFANKRKCRCRHNGWPHGTEATYVYGGVQCMLIYNDEYVLADSPFASFGLVVKKTRKTVSKLPYLDVRTIFGQQQSLPA